MKNLRKNLLLSIAITFAIQCFSQSHNIETLLPSKEVNQTIRKMRYSIMGIGATVNVQLNCDLNNYSKCNSDIFFGKFDVGIKLPVNKT